MSNSKVRNPCKGGKTSSERESKIFSPSLGNEGAPEAIFVGSGRWNGRKKIFEQRRASFFETSRERVEAEDEMPKFKIQMKNDVVRNTSPSTKYTDTDTYHEHGHEHVSRARTRSSNAVCRSPSFLSYPRSSVRGLRS